MCHQTVCLIARQLEAAGIATVSLTSARDITEAANPPRAVFLDYPLGHTSGRVGEAELNRSIVTTAVARLTVDQPPGTIIDLDHVWAATDDWKDAVMRVDSDAAGSQSTTDDRVARHDTPQYESPSDAAAASASHDGEMCVVCAGIDF